MAIDWSKFSNGNDLAVLQQLALLAQNSSLSQQDRTNATNQLNSLTGGQQQTNSLYNKIGVDPNVNAIQSMAMNGMSAAQIFKHMTQNGQNLQGMNPTDWMSNINGIITPMQQAGLQIDPTHGFGASSPFNPQSPNYVGSAPASSGGTVGTGTPSTPGTSTPGTGNDYDTQQQIAMRQAAMDSSQYNPNGVNTWGIQNATAQNLQGAFGGGIMAPSNPGIAPVNNGTPPPGTGAPMPTTPGISPQVMPQSSINGGIVTLPGSGGPQGTKPTTPTQPGLFNGAVPGPQPSGGITGTPGPLQPGGFNPTQVPSKPAMPVNPGLTNTGQQIGSTMPGGHVIGTGQRYLASQSNQPSYFGGAINMPRGS